MKSKFVVTNVLTHELVTVACDDESDAALRGAIKLGIRRSGRLPSTCRQERYGTYSIYGPLDAKTNAQHHCGTVIVVKK